MLTCWWWWVVRDQEDRYSLAPLRKMQFPISKAHPSLLYGVLVYGCMLLRTCRWIPIIFLCVLDAHRFFLFFFNDTATTEIYTLSLHDALPIPLGNSIPLLPSLTPRLITRLAHFSSPNSIPISFEYTDRKSTRLNSSHTVISYAVFCLKKKKNNITEYTLK